MAPGWQKRLVLSIPLLAITATLAIVLWPGWHFWLGFGLLYSFFLLLRWISRRYA